jgi:hypothetical protein
VSMHDAGRILNPALFDGQVRGGFAMAVGAALFERLVYAEDGGVVTGSLLDYALPTASMVPELEILHQETPSPVTPLGAKGVAEGNSMSTPACIANAVADALGVAEVSLPLTPERLLEMVRRRGEQPISIDRPFRTEQSRERVTPTCARTSAPMWASRLLRAKVELQASAADTVSSNDHASKCRASGKVLTYEMLSGFAAPSLGRASPPPLQWKMQMVT